LRLARVTLVLTVATLGCSTVRQATYPPDFRYVDTAALDAAMGRLAHDVIAIDKALAQRQDVDPVNQEKVVALLVDMQSATREVASSGARTNHPVLDRHFEQFQDLLARALAEVKSKPPRYYLAGNVTGGCLACHASRR
jgi:hypothetical protein